MIISFYPVRSALRAVNVAATSATAGLRPKALRPEALVEGEGVDCDHSGASFRLMSRAMVQP